jgi:hypothetical protein
MSRGVLIEGILPYLDAKLIRRYYDAAPGREFESGKFTNRESSAALAANAFGFFCPSDRASLLPRLPGAYGIDWPADDIKLESCQRFPWRGGRHPYLDVVVETPSHLIGIESKRFEPFRDKPAVSLSKAYWRKEWGTRMSRYEQVRDRLNAAPVFAPRCLPIGEARVRTKDPSRQAGAAGYLVLSVCRAAQLGIRRNRIACFLPRSPCRDTRLCKVRARR